jgi:hypothetical protein
MACQLGTAAPLLPTKGSVFFSVHRVCPRRVLGSVVHQVTSVLYSYNTIVLVRNKTWLRVKEINGYVRFEVFTSVTMKKGVFWDVTQCGPCKNRRIGGT